MNHSNTTFGDPADTKKSRDTADAKLANLPRLDGDATYPRTSPIVPPRTSTSDKAQASVAGLELGFGIHGFWVEAQRRSHASTEVLPSHRSPQRNVFQC